MYCCFFFGRLHFSEDPHLTLHLLDRSSHLVLLTTVLNFIDQEHQMLDLDLARIRRSRFTQIQICPDSFSIYIYIYISRSDLDSIDLFVLRLRAHRQPFTYCFPQPCPHLFVRVQRISVCTEIFTFFCVSEQVIEDTKRKGMSK